MAEADKIFIDNSFDVSTEQAAAARQRAEEDWSMIQKELADPDEHPAIKRRAESAKEAAEAKAKFFKERDDEVIVGIARSIFERGQALEAKGLPAEEVVTTIYDEIPEASMIAGMTEYTPWGYALNQLHFAVAMEASAQPANPAE